jgi:phospholipase C
MSPIDHIFVLMLENRSFDHLLGFSGITGTDPVTGERTSINGLTGSESNVYTGDGRTYTVSQPADWTMPFDPPHEFPDTLMQLCGPSATYPPGGPYPPIDNSGFVDAWMKHNPTADPGEILKCCSPDQLPVLNAIATEFALCDNWCASIPGPTWPNRFYALAASSGGLDCSPSTVQMGWWYSLFSGGFQFQHNTLFDDVGDAQTGWRLYRGDKGSPTGTIPIAGALEGVHTSNWYPFSTFAHDIAPGASYPFRYTWIEPNYGDLLNNSYEGGTSQHPMDSVVGGEQLIKQVYETLRANEALWESSLLIITWDEHGGFYDHVAPGPAPSPGDAAVMDGVNEFGFNFEQYGVRVPAVIASPYIAQNLVDHRLYDHASIPATVERLFGLSNLTDRDRVVNDVLTLSSPRDTPATLPNPSGPTVPPVRDPVVAAAAAAEPLQAGNLAGFVGVAAKADAELSPPAEQPAIQAKVAAIQTRGQAAEYVASVSQKLDAADAARPPAAQ